MSKIIPATEIEVINTSQKYVLLIDDDDDQLFVLSKMLEQPGLNVTAVRYDEIGWETLDPEQISCVVADVMMPDGGGLEILKKFRIIHPSIPVVMMSAGRDDLKQELLASGAIAFCPKYDSDHSLLNQVIEICTV